MVSQIARNASPVVVSDTADLPGASTCGLLVAVGGTLTVSTLGGGVTTLTVPAGWIPIVATRVWSTGTTATGITALRV